VKDRRRSGRDVALLFLVVLAVTLPFIDKPFHIDDDVYLKGADQILREPFHPLSGTQRIFGQDMPAYQLTQHPPLVSYVIAAVIALTGAARERSLHLAFLVFPLLAAAAAYRLAARFCDAPFAAAVLFVTMPAFIVSSHSVMTDVPFLAFALLSMTFFVSGVEARSGRDLAFAAVALVAAGFTQYRGLLLVPLFAYFDWARTRSVGSAGRVAAPLGITLSAWCLWNWMDIGVVHAVAAGSWIEFGPGRLLKDGAAYITLLGGCTIFPLAWGLPGSGRRWWAWPGAGAAVAVGLMFSTPLDGAQTMAAACFATSGCIALAYGLGPIATNKRVPRGDSNEEVDDARFLSLVFAVTLGSQFALNLFASGRSLLLALPFLSILWVRQARRDWRLPLTVFLTGLLGTTLAVADMQFAQAHRELALRLDRGGDSSTTWFTGEWGFRRYMEQREFLPVRSDGSGVETGDWLIVPDQASPAELDPTLVRRLELRDTVDGLASPLHLMSFEHKAGFYSNFWGPLPYWWGDGPLERVRVFRVRAP